MTAGGWPAVLADMEDGLARLETAGADDLEAAVAALDSTGPAAGLGPVPAELADRARRLGERMHTLIERFDAQRSTVGQKLAAIAAVSPAGERPGPRFLDITA